MDNQSLKNVRIIITAGPTREYLDPVRYLSNASSGKQGYAIASAAAASGADVTLISGPVNLSCLGELKFINIETACEMLEQLEQQLPADIVICVAAISDFRPAHPSLQKIKKLPGQDCYNLELIKNPDLLHIISSRTINRPRLVIGFAAETEDLLINAQKKLQDKQCDWILANDVSAGIGGDENQISLLNSAGTERWPRMSKDQVAQRLMTKISSFWRPGPESNRR
ncbi:MAG: hypothetical protein RIT35_299 [Pseudomonadota bacterium]